MKQILAALLCLLLCGCSPQASPSPEPPVPPSRSGMYDPDHPMEQAYPGEVRAYPLTIPDVQDIRPVENAVLVLSGTDATTLTLLTGETLQETASVVLEFFLDPEDPSLQISGDGISFFHPLRQETLVLDAHLREIRKISAPPQLSGAPLLSSDGKTLFYATFHSVMAWDLESGIRRTVKEFFQEQPELTGLHLDSSILQCSVPDGDTRKTLFLSAETGRELASLDPDCTLYTSRTRYFATVPGGNQQYMVFGETGDTTSLLLPEGYPTTRYYLPEDHAAVTVLFENRHIRLDYYELNTGILRETLLLEESQKPGNIINTKGHAVYILAFDSAPDCAILYRWDVLRQSPDPSNVIRHTARYCSSTQPDTEALEACRDYAGKIGEKYGITLLIGEEATAVQPWDYEFEPEHLAPVLLAELQLLDQRLTQYPREILSQTAAHFNGLSICLVRQIQGTSSSGSLGTATGIQFLKDAQAYVVITAGRYSQQALYHELFHAMETHILTGSTALDTWKDLNPPGFAYDNGYNPQRNSGIYLQGSTRAFVDTYSMSFPKEDRARIFEYALLPGNREVFTPERMQSKLLAVCTGIREAYGLKNDSRIFPWEQYLKNPLAPGT